jgi:hypothetical protein
MAHPDLDSPGLPAASNGNGAARASSLPSVTSPHMPLKQKMAVGFKSLLGSAKKLAIGGDDTETEKKHADISELFPKVDPAVDGEDCDRDCDSCAVHYPRSFKIDEEDVLYGFVKGWSTHMLVATGKTDWVRDVADEKGSVMQAIDNSKVSPSNGVCIFLVSGCLWVSKG